jgi:hypothetical protein
VTRLKIPISLASKHPSVQLVRCKWLIRYTDGVHRRTGVDWLQLWPLCDGAVIPAGCSDFVHYQPPSNEQGRLPSLVECIFNDSKFASMMHHLCRQINLLISVVVVPHISLFLLPIISKVHAPLHAREGTARHAPLRCPNSIKGLAGALKIIDRRQTIYNMHPADTQRSVQHDPLKI